MRLKLTLYTFVCVWISIQAIPQLLYANRKDVRMVDAGNPQNNSTVVVQGLEDAAAVDFVFSQESIFWTDVSQEVIKRAWLNGSQLREDVITTGLTSPDGLACDWLGLKLYWTDSETNRIEVSNLDGSFRKVLFWEDLDQPRAIALDPRNGYMYWSDWGETPKIEKAGMDGSRDTRGILIDSRDSKIYWPNGLTLDYQTNRLFWVDAKYHFIQSCALDGSDRQTIAEGDLPHPFALTLFEGRLYWTDWHTHAIHSCDKVTGEDRRLVYDNIFSPMDLHAYHGDRQPIGPSPCGTENGGCSHLCLMSPTPPHYTCACPTGVKLLPNNKTCVDGFHDLLLLARRTDLRRISLDTPDYTDVVLRVDNIKHAIAIDYDPLDGHVYWTDDETRAISRAYLDGSGQEMVVASEVDHPDGLAVDWVARNLYWTDTGTNRIEVARLNGTSRKVLISEDLDEPRAITLDPVRGYMYWTDWGKQPKIERANLDGTDRVVLVNTSLGWPNGLDIDFKENKMYWGDARTDRIEVANLDGSGRRVLLEGTDGLQHVFGFSLLGDSIYWTDWQKRSIERVDKNDASRRTVIMEQLPDLMGLKAVDVTNREGDNACAHDNWGCSHLCLMRPLPKGPTCACPMGLELLKNAKTCIVPEAFLLFSRRTDIRRLSLEATHNNVIIPLQGIKEAIAIDFDINDSRIYWTDTSLRTISRAFMNGSAFENIVQFGLEYPEAMAVDWVAHNLYWIDTGTKRIEVARIDGASRKVLIWRDLEPRAIAIDPPKGNIYFSNWINDEPMIERATLDGLYREPFIRNTGHVQGLAIDFLDQRLYWTSVNSHIIESCSLEQLASGSVRGVDRRAILSDLPHPSSLTQYQDFIYWTDWTTKTIERANKTNGQNRTKVQDQLEFIMDILVFHQSRQSGWNQCGVENGGCSHLCLAHTPDYPLGVTHHCACPTHYQLATDNKTCVPPESFLLYSQKTTIHRMVMDTHDAPDMVLPISGVRNVRAIDYDPVDHYLYWVDRRSKAIKRTRDNGTKAQAVVDSPSSQDIYNPYDLAIDFYTGHIYWTDSQDNVINVCTLEGKMVGVIVNESHQKPRAIAIAATQGYMFWTNVAKPPKIERADLDGTAKHTLFLSGLSEPGPIAVDPVRRRVFWADMELRRIESLDFEGGDHRVLADEGIMEPVGLTVLGDYLYWVDAELHLVERVHKTTAKGRLKIQGRLGPLSDIHGVATLSDARLAAHPCGRSNGGCSHLCVARADGNRRCSCPLGLVLAADELTCADPPTCAPDHFTCRSGATQCIPKSWRCDGIGECMDNSDEHDCPACSSAQFRCQTGDCVPRRARCDGVADCPDDSDEESCAPCPAGHWECPEDHVCVEQTLVCNGRPDCAEGGDEQKCPTRYGPPSGHPGGSATAQYTVSIVVCLLFVMAILVVVVFACRRKQPGQLPEETVMMLTKQLNNAVADLHTPPNTVITSSSLTLGLRLGPTGGLKLSLAHYGKGGGGGSGGSGGGGGGMGCVSGSLGVTTSAGSQSSTGPSYDRNHVTGASSSSSTATTHYPKETLNPPPSPVTDRSNWGGDGEGGYLSPSPPSTTRAYWPFSRGSRGDGGGGGKRRNNHIPPPPTPYSTDVCDDSEPSTSVADYRPTRHTRRKNWHPPPALYDSDPMFPPPPPTPRSHYLSDDMSCPPSPSTERSYFNPYPPPPSPVANSDC